MNGARPRVGRDALGCSNEQRLLSGGFTLFEPPAFPKSAEFGSSSQDHALGLR